MKRLFTVLITCIFAFICLLVPSNAFSGEINNIDVVVELLNDGTANITEIWDVDVADDWTEMYTVKDNMEDMQIKNFKVTNLEDNSTLEYVGDNWNSALPIYEKRNKCGIHITKSGAIELCWGITDEPSQKYKVTYSMTNAVNSYSDGYDGFNIRFINDKLSNEPKNSSVTVYGVDESGKRIEFNEDNTLFWAFGLDARTFIDNKGQIVVRTVEDRRCVDYCNLLVRFEDGLFEPVSKSDLAFEKLKKTAFVDSDFVEGDYEGNSNYSFWGQGDTHDFFYWLVKYIKLICTFAMLFGFTLVDEIKKKKKNYLPKEKNSIGLKIKNKDIKNADYCRDIPFEGNIELSYLILNEKNETNKSSLISAYFIKWIQNGYITFDNGSLDFSISKKKKFDDIEKSLWTIMLKASGPDNRLQPKELENWSKENYRMIDSFFDSVKQAGIDYGISKGYFTERKIQLTKAGKEEVQKLFGLKKYLYDFTLVNERKATDVLLWKEYLIYASVFGITKEVADQFKDILPSYFDNLSDYGWNSESVDIDDMWYIISNQLIRNMSQTLVNGYNNGYITLNSIKSIGYDPSEDSYPGSDGTGGYSSIGGGGGFSGGGSGGGGR